MFFPPFFFNFGKNCDFFVLFFLWFSRELFPALLPASECIHCLGPFSFDTPPILLRAHPHRYAAGPRRAGGRDGLPAGQRRHRRPRRPLPATRAVPRRAPKPSFAFRIPTPGRDFFPFFYLIRATLRDHWPKGQPVAVPGVERG